MNTNAGELRPAGVFQRRTRRTVRTGVAGRRRTMSLVPLDAALLLGALLLAEAAPPSRIPAVGIVWFILFPSLALLFYSVLGPSRPAYRIEMLDDVRGVVLATTLSAMTVLSVRVLITDDPSAAAQTARMWAFGTMFLVAGHVVLGSIELRARRRGERARPTLIIGAGRIGRLVAKRLLDTPELGLRPIGFLDKAPLAPNGSCAALPVLGASWDLDRVIEHYDVRQVIVTFSTAPHHVLLEITRRCHNLGVAVSVVPRLFESMTTKVRIDHVGGLPFISVPAFDPKGWQFRLKYCSDRVIAVALLIGTLPLLAVSAISVFLSLGRPILYRQVRIGRDGHRFEMLKFRSMNDGHDDGEALSLPPDTAPGGVEGLDRRSRAGKFLRRYCLDELPQLINVIRGEMSLVGPRPERPEFVEAFRRDIYRYGERLRVKSGMTGWAQVHGLRGQTSLADRVEWDNYYIENWSLWLDMKILLLTMRAVFRTATD